MDTLLQPTNSLSLTESCPPNGSDRIVSLSGSHAPGPFTIRYHYPVLYCGNADSPDMTLIAAAWSPEGFAIAADGFQVKANEPDKFDAQKIFHTPFRDNTGFAYACIGECQLFFASGDEFDFIEATHRITDDLARIAFPNDPNDYFNELGKRLFRELAFSDGNERLASHLSIGFAASRVIFVGYGNGTPIWTELLFSNTGTRFYPPDGVLNYPLRAFMVFAGSNTVAGNMEVSDQLSQPLSIQEASNMVQEYAQTCVANNASVEDCVNFKGHIHAATVTKEGFAWVIEPMAGGQFD